MYSRGKGREQLWKIMSPEAKDHAWPHKHITRAVWGNKSSDAFFRGSLGKCKGSCSTYKGTSGEIQSRHFRSYFVNQSCKTWRHFDTCGKKVLGAGYYDHKLGLHLGSNLGWA